MAFGSREFAVLLTSHNDSLLIRRQSLTTSEPELNESTTLIFVETLVPFLPPFVIAHIQGTLFSHRSLSSFMCTHSLIWLLGESDEGTQ